MRKMHQQQALEFVKLLEQANREIRTLIERGDIAGACSLLEDCQDGAIQLGNLIEKTEGEDFKGISLIEEYCESVYQFYERLGSEENVDAGKIYKILHQQLIKIENCIKNNVKIRKEVVFLPYKASMWDSLESIWEAAKEDPDCDVFVVPIPYYDKKKDGSLGMFHYEGGDFPDDVHVISYDTYALDKRRPDIIYIHNPYDAYNHVTSVDPRFYSAELKKHTERLVYVPYYVCDEQNVESNYSKFMAPGVINADVVVLQSENLRHVLIELLTEKAGGDRKYWGEKLVGLGSPKYDRILHMDKTLSQIPKSWEKVICKPDGNRKKVILYNTGLGGLLKNGMQMLQKIHSVLAYFYDRKENCALLWRPHPLLQATIKAMRPWLFESYQGMVGEYLADGWGVYDDTPDFHAAFALSDAYYGDYSSLVWLYQATEKPLLEQDVDILDYARRFITELLYYDGHYLWGTALHFNGLFRICPETCQAEYMGQFPGEKAEGYALFYGIAEQEEKLYFCPYNAKGIGIYDKRTARFFSIPMKKSCENIDRKFSDITAYGKYLYLKGRNIKAVVRLDAETGDLTYIDSWVREMEGRQVAEQEFLLQKGCVHQGGLYYLCAGARGLLRISPQDLSHEFIPLPDMSGKGDYSGIADGGEVLWLLSDKEGSLMYYDVQSGEMAEITSAGKADNFCRVGEYGYCFSFDESCIYRIYLKTREIAAIPLERKVSKGCICAVGKKIFLAAYKTGEFYAFDTERLELQEITLSQAESQYPKLAVREIFRENRKFNRFARESGFLNLKSLLEVAGDTDGHVAVSAKGNCGVRIHKYVKGLIS